MPVSLKQNGAGVFVQRMTESRDPLIFGVFPRSRVNPSESPKMRTSSTDAVSILRRQWTPPALSQ